MASSPFSKETGKQPSHLHFVLLHHGYHGRARDFYYLSSIAEDALKSERLLDSATAMHFVFVHPHGSDHLRTEDGVVACSKRYIDHSYKIIADTLSFQTAGPRKHMGNSHNNDNKDIDDNNDRYSAAKQVDDSTSIELHFSAVGHSMGGLILRAAFPHIMAKVEQLVAETPRVRGVHWDTFCTMAAPHLGVHYMRSLVMTFLGGSVGHYVSQAIADLFAKNTLLTDDLVTDECLAAWARYKRRVILSVVNDGTVLAYSSSFVIPISVRKRVCAALPLRQQTTHTTPPFSSSFGVTPTEAPVTSNSRSDLLGSAVVDAARGPINAKDYPNPMKTTLDVPNADTSVLHLAQHGIHSASSVEGLRRNAYELKELSEDLWPSEVLPEQRALAQRILQHVSPLELHMIDFRPLCDAPQECLPKHVAESRAQLSVCGRVMTYLGAHRFSHAAMACKTPFYYPEFFGFASEYVVADLLGIPLDIDGQSSGSKDITFSAV